MKVLLSVWVLLLALYFSRIEASKHLGLNRKSTRPKANKSEFMHAVDEETYKTLYSLTEGKFNVPLHQRTRVQKNTVVRYWRRKAAFSIRSDHNLYFNNLQVATLAQLPEIVDKTFTNLKSAGYKKIGHHLANVYAGIPERKILSETCKNVKYSQYKVQFRNKAIPKPVRAKKIQSQHQIDLIDFVQEPVMFKGKSQRYILSLMDIFSRFLWLRPLQRKTSKNVAVALDVIYTEHGPPDILQMDNGREFFGQVIHLCQKYKIKIIKGRPYHPQSQGKIERSHRTLKKKIQYDFISMGRKGVNWAVNLPVYCRIINDEMREELGWRSAFEVYFGRKSNNALKSLTVNVDIDTCEVDRLYEGPTQKQIRRHMKTVEYIRHEAKEAGKRIDQRTIRKHKRLYHPSIYRVGERVYFRFKKGTGKTQTHRYVIQATVQRRSKNKSYYKVKFVPPHSEMETTRWANVEDMTSLTSHVEKLRQNKEKWREATLEHRNKYYIALENSSPPQSDFHGMNIIFNPPGDGNCQFSALCHGLQKLGVYRSADTLRKEIVNYLYHNPNDLEGFPLELFAGQPWDEYLFSMVNAGTYGDHVTLHAAATIFNINIYISSSLGPDGATLISSPDHAFTTIYLGHYAEENSEHYVCLEPDTIGSQLESSFGGESDIDKEMSHYPGDDVHVSEIGVARPNSDTESDKAISLGKPHPGPNNLDDTIPVNSSEKQPNLAHIILKLDTFIKKQLKTLPSNVRNDNLVTPLFVDEKTSLWAYLLDRCGVTLFMDHGENLDQVYYHVPEIYMLIYDTFREYLRELSSGYIVIFMTRVVREWFRECIVSEDERKLSDHEKIICITAQQYEDLLKYIQEYTCTSEGHP